MVYNDLDFESLAKFHAWYELKKVHNHHDFDEKNWDENQEIQRFDKQDQFSGFFLKTNQIKAQK